MESNLENEYCPFCDTTGNTYINTLKETENFRVICDSFPITEGHILIIPKRHIPCVGKYDDDVFREFKEVYKEIESFISNTYGFVSTFEHGVIGQTVFHSHVHILPYAGNSLSVVPEGEKYIQKINSIEDLRGKDKYLFFSIGENSWLVDINLGVPRFFRDRFAQALGNGERGDWKATIGNIEIEEQFNKDISSIKKLWHEVI